MKRKRIFRSIIAIVLALVLALAPVGDIPILRELSMTANAATSDSGKCGDYATYSFSNGTMTISGTGAMTDFSSGSAQPWASYRGQITEVVIGSGITMIGSYSFYGCTALESVTINCNAAWIGQDTFRDCKNLTEVTITNPNGVKYPNSNGVAVSSGAFYAYKDPALTVYFGGTEADWNALKSKTAANGNDRFKNATVKYKCTITFAAGGGGGSMPPAEQYDGKTYTLPDCTFTKPTGKVFSHWSVDGANKNPGDKITITGNKTVTAVWTPATYTVTLNTNSGTINAGNVTGYTYGTGATLPTNVTKTGYTFGGWYAASSFSGSPVTAIGAAETGAKTFYAKWNANTYTVKYNGNGATGGSTADSTHTYDSAKNLTANGFTRKYTVSYEVNGGSACPDSTAEYTFDKWTANQDGSGNSYNNSQSVKNLAASGTVNLYAKWNSASVTLPAPTRTGYTFDGWYVNSGLTGTNYSAGASYTPTANTKLYAKWNINSYTVTLNKNSGKINAGDVTGYTYGTGATLPTDVTRTGYTFDGWYTAESSGTKVTAIGTTETGNKTFWARWTPNEYTVSFNANEGTCTTTNKTVTYDSDYGTLPSPTRTGYTFAGWYTAVSGGTQVTKDTTVEITEAQTLYAHWTINSYTVTYNYLQNGGASATKTTATVDYNSDIDLTPTATKSGWEFVGWNTNKDAITGLTSLKMGTANVTLYAIYKKTLTATFYSGSGCGTQTKSVTIYNSDTSGNVTALTLTEWDGYTALGWNSSASDYTAEKAAGVDISLTADTNYYGVYSKEVTLTYDANGGTGTVDSQKATRYANVHSQVTYSGGEIKLAAGDGLSRTGYTFAGWKTGEAGNVVKQPGNTVQFSDDDTCRAQWTINKYDVIYDYATNGGTSATQEKVSVAYNSGIDLTPVAEKDGWTFVGWNTDKDETIGLTSLTMGTADIKLYAIYKKRLTATFYSGSGCGIRTESVIIYNCDTSGNVTAPTLTEWDGYTTLGWNSSSSDYTAEKAAEVDISLTADTSYYGVYSRKVTLTYDANGGTGTVDSQKATRYANVHSQVTYSGGEIKLAAEDGLSRTGYTFAGWKTSTTGDEVKQPGDTVQFSDDDICRAQWTANTYTVIYNGNGSTGGSTADSSHTYDVAENLTENGFEKKYTVTFNHNYLGIANTDQIAAYIFDGWSTSENGTVDYTDEESVTNLTAENGGEFNLYAVWTSVSVNYTPEREGYTFGGWYDNTGCLGDRVDTDGIYTPSDNITLYARWTANTYTVIYNGNGNTGGSTADSSHTYDVAESLTGNGFEKKYTVTFNHNYSESVNADQTATYIFDGWSTGENGTVDYADEESVINLTAKNGGEFNLYAVWTSVSVSYTPEREGYTFSGWYDNTGCSGDRVDTDGTYTPSADITLYARWTVNNYTVTYNYSRNGGTSATETTATVDYGDSIDLTPAATKNGWDFVGWNTDKDAATGLENLTMGATGKTLYAIYKKTLTATFYSGSDCGTKKESVTIYNNETSGNVTAPELTAWSGYTILGWNSFVSGYTGGIAAHDSITISEDTDYYGVYSREVTLCYDAGGGTGTLPTSQTATSYVNVHSEITYSGGGITLASGDGLSREGYTFAGWKTSEAGTEVKQPDDTVQFIADCTCYANWTANKYTVIYHGNESTLGSMAESSHTFDEAKELTANGFKREYTVTFNHNYEGSADEQKTAAYTFDGWLTGADDTEIKYENSESVTNLTSVDGGKFNLYAKWTPVSVSCLPTRPCYTFDGWYAEEDGSGERVDSDGTYTPSADITLYAKWTKKEITGITFGDYTGTYDCTSHSVTVTGTKDGDTVEYFAVGTSSSYSGANPAFKDAGTYTVLCKVSRDDYFDLYGTAAVTISQNKLSPDDIVVKGIVDKTYTGGEITQDITLKDKDGHVIPSSEYKVEYSANISAGDVTVTITNADGGNYNLTEPVTRTFNIDKATIEGITSAGYEGIYDGGEYSITVKGVLPGDTVEYSVDGTTYSETNPVFKDAETYIVDFKVKRDNFNDFTGTETVTIHPKDVTISGISAEDKTYDGQVAASVTGTAVILELVDSDTDKVSVSVGTAAFADKNAGKNKEVTFTGFTLTGEKAGNYHLSAQPESVRADISEAPLTIVWEDETYIYNGKPQKPELDSVSGIVSGDGCSAAVSGEQTNAGTSYTATAGLVGEDKDNYYILSGETKDFTIEPKELTGDMIALDGTGNTYSFTGSVIMPLVTVSDGTALTSGDYTTGGEESATAVGSYELTVTGQENYKGTVSVAWHISDSNPPTGSIAVSANNWSSFSDTITFGLFFKEPQTVTITGQDGADESGVDKIYYYLSETAFSSTSELAGLSDWTELSVTGDTQKLGSFSINPDKKLIIYAKITDKSGHVAYINSDGFTPDATSPVIEGVEDGKAYCAAQTVAISDDNLDSVTVNGKEVTLVGGKYTLAADGTEYTVAASDKAGNKTTVTVTVNNGHTSGRAKEENRREAACTKDGSYDTAVYCEICDAEVSRETHTIEKTGHSYDNEMSDTCNVCGYVRNLGDLKKSVIVEEGAPETYVNNTREELLPLLTKEEAKAMENGENINVWLEVKPLDETEILEEDAEKMEQAAYEALGETASIYYIDASLFKKIGNREKQQIHEAGIKISITIVIPEELRNKNNRNVKRNYAIVRLHDGMAEIIPCSYSEESYELTVKSDKFSTYAIVYSDEKMTDGANRSMFLAKGEWEKENSLKITWMKYKGANGYELYWSYCNGKNNYKKLKTVKEGTTLKAIHKNLEKNRSYKYYVAAYKIVNGKKKYVAASPVIHVAMKYQKYTNVKKITGISKEITVKEGKTFQLAPSAKKENKNKQLLSCKERFRYYTNNKKIAEVNRNGKLKAKKKGSCTIYVIALNGVRVKAEIIVK